MPTVECATPRGPSHQPRGGIELREHVFWETFVPGHSELEGIEGNDG
jgi:hypothetical protein